MSERYSTFVEVGDSVQILLSTEMADNTVDIEGDYAQYAEWDIPLYTCGVIEEVQDGLGVIIFWDRPCGGSSLWTCPAVNLLTLIQIRRNHG